MGQIQVIDQPIKGKIATVCGQIPLIVRDHDPIIQTATITANGTYIAPEGVDGYNPITVEVTPFISGSFTLEDSQQNITLPTTKRCSHVLVFQHQRSYTEASTVVGQMLFDTQLSCEITNPYNTYTIGGECSVIYNDDNIIINNVNGHYPANVRYDWWAW